MEDTKSIATAERGVAKTCAEIAETFVIYGDEVAVNIADAIRKQYGLAVPRIDELITCKCGLAVGPGEGQCTGWHPDFKCPCGFERAFGTEYKFCPHCGKPKESDSATPAAPPRPGAEPLTRRPKKLSNRAQAIEARRRSDPLGQDREDIDYSDDSLPSAR